MTSGMHYVVVAEFRVKPGAEERFTEVLDQHARNSRTGEPGCLAFDVCQHPEDPAHFLLYEVYRDEAAYAAHRETESYRWFFGEVGELLEPGPDGAPFQRRSVLARRPHLEAVP